MKQSFIGLISGLIFAIGLGLSGMTQPQKVLGFLDVFGKWDPSLVFVMLFAVLISGLTNLVIRHKARPILNSKWDLPATKPITKQLIVGSMIFGIGWGLLGYCPGPAIVSIVTFQTTPLMFVAAMIFGMFLYKIYERRGAR